MSKNLFASEKVMEDYLTALLFEDEVNDSVVEKKSTPEVELPADKINTVTPDNMVVRGNAVVNEETKTLPVVTDELIPQLLTTKKQHSTLLPLATQEREVDQEQAKDLKPVAKLLESVNQFSVTEQQPVNKTTPELVKKVVKEEIQVPVELPVEPVIKAPEAIIEQEIKDLSIDGIPPSDDETPSYREGDFQALFFSVAGLTVAVPLTELGGIHNLDKTNNLFGKPNWFIGVMVHRDNKINVVDTALWVMPEKYNEELQESLNYKYLIMLNDSHWGLACESLVNTVVLTQEDVKWRENSGKRPWLAGLVKKKMCALLNVNQLINLLEQGLSS